MASSTVRVMMPLWSNVGEAPSRPAVLMRPYVGLSPTQPHNAAWFRRLPPVSLPVAAVTRPAATAAADPPLDPPAMRLTSQGLRVVPKNGLIVVTPPPSS